MPRIAQDLDAEQAQFDSVVKQIEEWWTSPRHAHIKRSANTLALFLFQDEADLHLILVHT